MLHPDIQFILHYFPTRPQWKREIPSHHMILAYQLDGSYDHFFDGKKISVAQDSFLFLHASDCYSVTQVSYGSCIAIHFTANVPIDLSFQVFSAVGHPHIKKEFLRILSVWNRCDEISQYEVMASFYKIWSWMLRFCQTQNNRFSQQSPLSRAHNYLSSHFQDAQLTVSQAAREAGISERWLCTQFQEVYHTSPSRFLTSLRITAATKLLQSRHYSLREIAESTGFSSVSYFIRVFRREMGITPHAFQKENS